jgi:hypothetical protein
MMPWQEMRPLKQDQELDPFVLLIRPDHGRRRKHKKINEFCFYILGLLYVVLFNILYLFCMYICLFVFTFFGLFVIMEYEKMPSLVRIC